VLQAVRAPCADIGTVDVRVTQSQVSFRRRRGFTYLWMPGRWLSHPTSEVVLSIALDRHDPSARWKDFAHPSARIWMHHLEIHDPAEIDVDVIGWLREAFDVAA
jgi:hypothetical protein